MIFDTSYFRMFLQTKKRRLDDEFGIIQKASFQLKGLEFRLNLI